MKAFTHTPAARLTQIDYDREMALVLTDVREPALGEIGGVVRLAAIPGEAKAVFALLVRKPIPARGSAARCCAI